MQNVETFLVNNKFLFWIYKNVWFSYWTFQILETYILQIKYVIFDQINVAPIFPPFFMLLGQDFIHSFLSKKLVKSLILNFSHLFCTLDKQVFPQTLTSCYPFFAFWVNFNPKSYAVIFPNFQPLGFVKLKVVFGLWNIQLLL